MNQGLEILDNMFQQVAFGGVRPDLVAPTQD